MVNCCRLRLLLLLSITSASIAFVLPSARIGRATCTIFQGTCSTRTLVSPPVSQNTCRDTGPLTRSPGAACLSGTSNDDESSSNVASTESNTEEDGEDVGVDPARFAALLKNFKEMALPYYQESKAGRWLFAGMVGITLLNSGVSVAFSYVGKDFWNALSSKDAANFYPMLAKYAAALVVGMPVSVLYRFQRERLAVAWREWLTDRTLQLYQSNRVYYALERGGEVDNPDQRIAEDVRSFTAFSLQFFITIVTSIIDLVSFSFILYSIQPSLFIAIIAYASFGTLTTTAIGKKLVPLNFEKLQKEANFRYSLVRVRDNAESIAFYAGEDIEGREVSNRLDKVIDNRKEIIGAQRNLEFFTTGYQYFIQILPVWVVAPRFFAGQIQLGVVSQSVGAFNHILNDLSVIVNQFENLSTFAAAIDRLSQFMEAIREADEDRSDADGLLMLPNATDTNGAKANVVIEDVVKESRISLHQMAPLDELKSSVPNGRSHAALLSLENLTLSTPDRKRTLISGLDLQLKEGENLLIVGSSGAGKSSLLRAIAGLWTAGDGIIERLSDEDVYFLPQRPYCALGSLKDQLLYPSMENINPDDYPDGHRLSKAHLLRQSMTDQDLLDVLEAVDLGELPSRAGDGDPIKGLNVVLDWSNTLSLGEQQRLAFGRLLVNRPRLVIMDESTSALDVATEAKMYGLLAEMARKELTNIGGHTRAGLTYISVGHRPSLLVYHDTKLRLNGGDDNEISKIEKASVDIGSLSSSATNM